MRKKRILALILSIFMMFAATACSSDGGNDPDGTDTTTSADEASNGDENGDSNTYETVELVVVATEGAFPPFNYFDENGDLVGFDIDVINAVGELLPDIDFTIEAVEWESFFLGLDSGRYEVTASQINKNEQREEKYLFGDVPYLYSANAIIYKEGRTDIRTVEDLHGKKVAAALGSYNTTWLEEYNAENGDPIIIEYYDAEAAIMFQEIASDRVDAALNHPVLAKYIAEEQNLPIDVVIAPEFGIKPVLFMYAKTDNGYRYKELIDEALLELTENGTLKELSIKWCGGDYTTVESTMNAS